MERLDRIFFAPNGSPWRTCHPDHPEAEAFGPTGHARRLSGFKARDVRPSLYFATFNGERWLMVRPLRDDAVCALYCIRGRFIVP